MKKQILILFVIIVAFLFSCKEKKEKKEDNVFYTCSMHPQIMETKPGKCPVCHMELTKVIVDPKMENASLMLSKEQIRLGNITMDTVHIRSINNEKTLSGIITIDQNKSSSISSFIEGRIEKLYIKSIGETIQKGQPLYEIYSETLMAAEKDFLIAKQQNKVSNNGLIDYSQLAEVSRQKLLLWGMTGDQINELEKNGEVKNSITIYSKNSGIISAVMMHEGDYLMEGSTIFKLNDLSSIWVEAQLYPSEISAISDIGEVEVTFPTIPGNRIKGVMNFINPELNAQSKINIGRIEIQNLSQLYKPGMQAYINLNTDQKKSVAIPSNAILRNEKGATVWIQNGKGSFEPRMVSLGIENTDFTEITDGLKEGEVIVVSGAYLLESEYIFRKGADPMARMKM